MSIGNIWKSRILVGIILGGRFGILGLCLTEARRQTARTGLRSTGEASVHEASAEVMWVRSAVRSVSTSRTGAASKPLEDLTRECQSAPQLSCLDLHVCKQICKLMRAQNSTHTY